jgi:hypothetical protein
MAKVKPIDAVGKIVAVLEALDAADRVKVIQSALTLIGDGEPSLDMTDIPSPSIVAAKGRGKDREKAYFDAKNPRTKIEELAVAARYLEEAENATSSTRADLERVIKAARRNFDGKNFRRDLDNARKANLFTRGTGRDSVVLSAHGQNYVDALPNRDALQELDKPRKARRRGSTKGSRAAGSKARK